MDVGDSDILFRGRFGGAAAAIGFAARLNGGDSGLIRDARRIAAIGALISTPLLIADLGRPERFLNMLRVSSLNRQCRWGRGSSRSSVALRRLPWSCQSVRRRRSGCICRNRSRHGYVHRCPARRHRGARVVKARAHSSDSFRRSALGSAVSLLQLRGHDAPALNKIGIAAAAFETLSRVDRARSRPRVGALQRGSLRRPESCRTGSALSASRWTIEAFPRLAAVSTLIGSVMTRFAWVAAG